MKRKLQIFVSSTYTDLIKERQAAVEAILRSSHIPAGMELFAAGSESQLEIIKRWIDESDIYMLLLGGRYGSIDPKTGLSYTEIEYRYAMDQNKPLFAVILSEDFLAAKVKVEGIDTMERNDSAKLITFKTLASGKISRFAEDLKDIKVAVLESLLDIQSRYSLKGWIKEDQVPDVSELVKQITDLKEEKSELEKKIRVRDSQMPTYIGDFTYDEIKDALSKTRIIIPPTLTADYSETDLFSLTILYQGRISAGLNNSAGISKLESFLFYQVCAKLRIYDLIDSVNVPNAQWKKLQTSKLGNKFIAFANIRGENPGIGPLKIKTE